MSFNCPLLEQKLSELRELINKELQTTPYIVDLLIAKLLDDLMHSYVNNYAAQIQYWREITRIIKQEIALGNIEDEIKRTDGNS